MKSKLFFFASALFMTFSLIAVPARASEWDQATKVIFSNAVEVPGTVLQPGTYWFVLANSDSDRDMVQIFSADRTKLYATLNTVPMERRGLNTETAFSFIETPGAKSEALLPRVYPRNTTGDVFLFSSHVGKELTNDT